MSFPPPGPHFLPNLSAMASLMNLASNQYQIAPMGGVMPMQMPLTGLPVPPMTMGITVPTGVTSISAPPMRKITQEVPQLLPNPSIPNTLLFSMPNAPNSGPMSGILQGIPVNQGPIIPNRSNSNLSSASIQRRPVSNGPAITVFVGNITERASDMLIRQLLSRCGTVNNWKRVQGANGKLQGFGFCEYGDPESAIRAIRLLHDFEISDKKLVVKADAKAKEKLDDYMKSKAPDSQKLNWSSPKNESQEVSEEDSELLEQLRSILKEHEVELSKDPDPNKAQSRRYDKRSGEPAKPENLADMEMEEEKRSLIHREIDKFRDTYKIDENERKSTDSSQNRDSKPISSSRREFDKSDGALGDREHSIEPDSSSRKNKSRDRTPTTTKDRYYSSSSRNRDRIHSDRHDRERAERSKDRDRSERMDRIDRERNEDRNIAHSNSDRQIDENEEAQEKRRLERRLREKEASYQKRLRNWEAREIRKAKEHKKYEMKQELRKNEEVREIRKLKQFLEDYDDDRDDAKYYKSSALARRLKDREKEKEDDARDRRQEKRELEELKRKLMEEGHPDPDMEAQKRLNSVESNRERDKLVSAKIKELMNEARLKSKKPEEENSASNEPVPSEIHVKSFSFMGINKVGHSSKSQTITPLTPTEQGSQSDKRKKLTIQDVFNANDDEEQMDRSKRRKLPPLNDDNTDSNQSLISNTAKSSMPSGPNEEKKQNLSSEEKKKQVKSLIERIPTTKEELFRYKIDWDMVDSTLMEKRIRPWVNKKITEYIGEEEQALLDFICSKLQAKSPAQCILDDVAMVLDDEAEVFVVKMWRLIIYEIEARKLGLGK